MVISLHDLGAPVLVVGEVKHRGVVDTEDLANLGRVQTWLRSVGIECLILRGTLGDTVTGEQGAASSAGGPAQQAPGPARTPEGAKKRRGRQRGRSTSPAA